MSLVDAATRRTLSAEWLRARSGWRMSGLILIGLWLNTLSIVGNASKKVETVRAGALTPAAISHQLVQLGFGALLFATLFGVLLSTTEFRYGSIARSSRTAGGAPRLLGVKAAVGAAAGLVFGVFAAAGSVITTSIVLRAHTVPFVVDRETIWCAVGVVATCGAACAWGVLLGWLGRAQVATLIGVFAWTLIAEPAVFAVLPQVGRFLPGGAETSVYRDFSSPWTLSTGWGALLLAGWLAVAGVVCAVSIRRRDLL